jgi:hypothetical protein
VNLTGFGEFGKKLLSQVKVDQFKPAADVRVERHGRQDRYSTSADSTPIEHPCSVRVGVARLGRGGDRRDGHDREGRYIGLGWN